jgi:hypothetical protein
MSETVKAALIGATGAVVAALMAATAQIVVAYINKRSQEQPKPRPSAPLNDEQNDVGKRRPGVVVKIFLVVIVILLLTVGIFGLVKLSDEFKNGILVAAATIVAVLFLQIQMKEPKNMKKRKRALLIIIPLGGALLGIGIARARQAIGGTPPLSAPVCISNNFYPSGYMGDGEGESKKGTDPIDLNDQWTENCHSEATCTRIIYHPPSNKWAGVVWQYPDGNWGDEPGRTIVGAKKLVFWARGERGGELVSFKVGGNNKKKYKDSLDKSLGPIKLTTEWHPYEIDLGDADTSSVIGAFAWSASAKGNPNGFTFYLEGICFKK